MQPGQTISPNSNPEDNTNLDSNKVKINDVSSKPPSQIDRLPASKHEEMSSSDNTQSDQNLPKSNQIYTQEAVDNSIPYSSKAEYGIQEAVEWTASEYVDHEKQKGWFFILAIITVIVSVAVYFLSSKDIVAAIAIVVVAIMFGIIASRKPRTLEYSVSPNGLQISQKHYPYLEFKSFMVVADVAMHYVQLQPLQRFMPPIIIYYPPELEQTIVNTLQIYVPYEERSRDMIDRLMLMIRF